MKLQKQHTQNFLGYKFSMVIIFVEGSGEITKVSADPRKGNYIFIYRIRTLCHVFALWRKNLLIGSAKPSSRYRKVVSYIQQTSWILSLDPTENSIHHV